MILRQRETALRPAAPSTKVLLLIGTNDNDNDHGNS
jgi:hypothetical protein